MRAFNALFGLLLLGSLVAGGCESEAPEATVDPALAVALQPACAGDAVVGAGLVATITTAPNHVVVLDVGGALSEFARAMPAAWFPPSLADTELVTCVTEMPRHQIQVCEYYGGDITRYAVTDEFRVVEAASGREVARFTITDEPRICATTENASTTELTGYIEPETVLSHLAGLIENGVFVDPDLPASSDKPGPKGIPEPSSVPPGKPTTAPSTSPDAIDLRAALADQLVTVAGTGDGLQSLDIEVRSEVDRSLEISIEAGTLLDPRARGTQTMMVVWGTTISLAPEATESTSLEVACVQMHQDQPTGDDSFTVSRAEPEPDLLLLLAEPSLADASGRVEQFAVWTITNNPRQNGYVGLTSSFSVFGTGPSDDELGEIKSIFESAGIDTDKYRALR